MTAQACFLLLSFRLLPRVPAYFCVYLLASSGGAGESRISPDGEGSGMLVSGFDVAIEGRKADRRAIRRKECLSANT